MRILTQLALALILTACTPTTTTMQLYPINDAAAGGGFVITCKDDDCTAQLPSGELLTGKAHTTGGMTTTTTTMPSHWIAGRWVPGGLATSQSYVPVTGTASLIGTKGTRLDCEYSADDTIMGICTTSTGGQYRLHE